MAATPAVKFAWVRWAPWSRPVSEEKKETVKTSSGPACKIVSTEFTRQINKCVLGVVIVTAPVDPLLSTSAHFNTLRMFPALETALGSKSPTTITVWCSLSFES